MEALAFLLGIVAGAAVATLLVSVELAVPSAAARAVWVAALLANGGLLAGLALDRRLRGIDPTLRVFAFTASFVLLGGLVTCASTPAESIRS